MTQNPIIQPQHIRMSPIERQMGRLMRAPDGHDSGGESNNTNGNPPPPSGDSNTQNNNGDDFDPTTFWNTEAEVDDGPPKGSAPESAPVSTDSNQPPSFAQNLMNRINGLKFDDVMTAEVGEQINNGDFKGFNEAIGARLQAAVKESMTTNVQLLKEFSSTLTQQVQSMIDGALGSQRNQDELVKAIPSAANPKVAPAIRAIYDQALTRSKGDVQRAIKETRSMLSTISGETASDLNLDVAPRDPHANRTTAPATDWLEELTKR